MQNDGRRKWGKFSFSLVLALFPCICLGSGTKSTRSGKEVFQQCAACHSLEPGANGVGPSLAGVFGRKAGSLETFRYSRAMKESKITWNSKTLDQFLAKPQAFVSGNRMPFSGLPDAYDRRALIDFLKHPRQ